MSGPPARVALVTGAGQGLGRAVCRRLAEDGCRIVAVDIIGENAERTAKELGGEARTCDVGDVEQVAALAASLPDGIDVLINNCGIYRYHTLLGGTRADIDIVLQVNLIGTLNCCLAFAPGMIERGGGAIVNFTSAAAPMRAQGVGIYPVSKAAIEALSQQLAVELGPKQVRVNVVGPGSVPTEGTIHAYAGERMEQRARGVPMGRVGTPEDIADVVGFLVSPAARYVNGQIVYVDGGSTAGMYRPA
jgi:NAD(P)-dependent dehydrogenase (short-subunit alcohol dehydrogenase family)